MAKILRSLDTPIRGLCGRTPRDALPVLLAIPVLGAAAVASALLDLLGTGALLTEYAPAKLQRVFQIVSEYSLPVLLLSALVTAWTLPYAIALPSRTLGASGRRDSLWQPLAPYFVIVGVGSAVAMMFIPFWATRPAVEPVVHLAPDVEGEEIVEVTHSFVFEGEKRP